MQRVSLTNNNAVDSPPFQPQQHSTILEMTLQNKKKNSNEDRDEDAPVIAWMRNYAPPPQYVATARWGITDVSSLLSFGDNDDDDDDDDDDANARSQIRTTAPIGPLLCKNTRTREGWLLPGQ